MLAKQWIQTINGSAGKLLWGKRLKNSMCQIIKNVCDQSIYMSINVSKFLVVACLRIIPAMKSMEDEGQNRMFSPGKTIILKTLSLTFLSSQDVVHVQKVPQKQRTIQKHLRRHPDHQSPRTHLIPLYGHWEGFRRGHVFQT